MMGSIRCHCESCDNDDFLFSEVWRAACESRFLLTLDKEGQVRYLKGVDEKRGRPAAVKLWEDAKREQRETAQ